ncbi:MAG: hypothetical protein KBF88_16840, partial [Polyangiaceae bacterium]|nr:hypothetical protein [Polyangiaceae bacterium]
MSVKKRYLGRSTIGALVMTRLALAGPADDLVEKGKAHLEKREYVQASEAFRKAETLAYEDPSDSVATAIKKGLALADAGLLRAAVETQSKAAGNDMAALVELHRLHLRLRTIGGDKSIAADIERAMNIRASLILSEFEKDTAVRNIQPLLDLGRFPELGESIQKRLQVLSAKPWRVYDGRANVTKDPLVAQVFRGAAAKISGDAIPSRTSEIEKLLLPYRRASEITVNAVGPCAPLADAAKQAGLRGGALQVDANVTIDSCNESSRSETKRVTEKYTVSIPYQTEEDVAVQSCGEVKVPVSYCINPYTKDGCVGSSDTSTQYRCTTTTQRQTVTRYRDEPRTREVDRTFVYTTRSATLKWKRSYAGQEVDQSAVLSATLINGAGTPLGKLITDRLRENLEEAVNAVISQRAAGLRAEGDKARASGNLDQAESSYLQAILMG